MAHETTVSQMIELVHEPMETVYKMMGMVSKMIETVGKTVSKTTRTEAALPAVTVITPMAIAEGQGMATTMVSEATQATV